MKQTQRVFLECVGEIRQIYKATNVMIKCGGGPLEEEDIIIGQEE